MQRLLAALVGAVAAWPLAQNASQRFTSVSTIVPVAVRVIDSDGRPVSDLTLADFSVEENGTPQNITTFQRDLSSGTNSRWIVIVLGEGRLQMPFKSIDALQDFVRDSLEPTDHIGVLAYNRWFPFSTRREAIVDLLDRYKSQAEAIQTSLENERRGPPATRGQGLGVDPRVQEKIDFIFRENSGQPVHEFAPPSQLGRMSASFAAGMRFGQGRFIDSLHIYGAVDYLRRVQGDKHILFLVEQAYSFGPEHPSRLAQTAADNRIAIHIIQTGGLGRRMTSAAPTTTHGGGTVGIPDISSPSITADVEDVAIETGGLAFIHVDARGAFNKIASALTAGYLLGYVPADQSWNGEYRRITVRVRRPGLVVLYRHGYRAEPTGPLWDNRAAITDARMAEAAAHPGLPGILLKVRARRTPGSSVVDVELSIEPSQIAFSNAAGVHSAEIDVGLWAVNRSGLTVGSSMERVQLRIDEVEYRQLTRSDVVLTRRVVTQADPYEVRAAVYDYENDRIGSIATKHIER